MSIEKAFLDSLGLSFFEGQNPQLLLNYNKDPEQGPPSLGHLTACDYVEKSYITKELFDSYYKFTFVRNPWARLVSIYRYFEYHRYLKFEDFLVKIFPKLQQERSYFVMPQYDYIFCGKGNKKLDFVGKFENLKEDFKVIQKNMAFPVGSLEHINKRNLNYNWYSRWNLKFVARQLKKNPEYISRINLRQKAKSKYQDYYNSNTKAIVSEFYKKDIEYFNYQFEA
ncbi:sulfotransferase family protein [Gramella lutea]|uniref:Sulfotransferase family protein n=2 Tax=Christiangramia lutea TaxID=1607951 RepID=A0A9X1UZZ2_9FLAO|nr:sulfotransferase family protein [Christiangramia lutea]